MWFDRLNSRRSAIAAFYSASLLPLHCPRAHLRLARERQGRICPRSDQPAGYDPDLRDHSPGTVLLYLILESLFESKEFRYLDFSPIKYFYKSFFATDHQLCARALHFRWRLSSLIAVVMHLAVTALSKMGSSALAMFRRQRLVPQVGAEKFRELRKS